MGTEADGASVVGDAGKWDLLAEHRPAQDHPLMASQAGQESFEFRQQTSVRLGVVVGRGQVDVPLAVDRGAVGRVGEILGREPEVERVPAM